MSPLVLEEAWTKLELIRLCNGRRNRPPDEEPYPETSLGSKKLSRIISDLARRLLEAERRPLNRRGRERIECHAVLAKICDSRLRRMPNPGAACYDACNNRRFDHANCYSLVIWMVVSRPAFGDAPGAAPPLSPLFDGKSFAGWEGNLQAFRIQDGAVVGGQLDKPVPRNEYLCPPGTSRFRCSPTNRK